MFLFRVAEIFFDPEASGLAPPWTQIQRPCLLPYAATLLQSPQWFCPSKPYPRWQSLSGRVRSQVPLTRMPDADAHTTEILAEMSSNAFEAIMSRYAPAGSWRGFYRVQDPVRHEKPQRATEVF